MSPKHSLTRKEIAELEYFLLSDKTPDNCMDIVTLHGFFTNLVIGPETLVPSVWMPEIWGDDFIWDSMEEAERIMGLLMTFFNMVVAEFSPSPAKFKLRLYSTVAQTDQKILLENWCSGFMVGIDIAGDVWEELIGSPEHREIFSPLVFWGTDRGRKILEETEEASDASIRNWVELIEKAVRLIYNFWLPYRKAVHESTKSIVTRVGRNEPCPCGSGKKFKHCCMN